MTLETGAQFYILSKSSSCVCSPTHANASFIFSPKSRCLCVTVYPSLIHMSHWTRWCLCFISPLLLRNINMLLACVHITSTPLLYVSKCKNFISSTSWPFYSSITFFRHTLQRRLHLLFCLFLLCILALFKTKDPSSWLQNTLSQRAIALLLSQVRFLHIVPPCNLFFSH